MLVFSHDSAMCARSGLRASSTSSGLTPAAFGSGALALCAVAFAASYLKAIFFADNLALGVLFFFTGKWTFDVLYLVSERRLRGTELVVQLLLWSPLAATVTALAGVLLLVALRPVLGRAQA